MTIKNITIEPNRWGWEVQIIPSKASKIIHNYQVYWKLSIEYLPVESASILEMDG